MPDQLTLPVCVLPGCPTPVAAWGDACDGCITACGTMLRPTTRPAMTHADIEARDTQVRRSYQLQKERH